METITDFLSKRKQLLVGTQVRCKKNVPVHLYAPKPNNKEWAFIKDNIYNVPEANNIKDENGNWHTWDVEPFIETFDELPNLKF